MQFSTQQMRVTHNVIAQADDATLKSLFVSLETARLKTLLKTVERSIQNRIPYFQSCRCANCGIHDVNKEDGVEVCDSCLAE